MHPSSILACHGLNPQGFKCQMLLTNMGHRIFPRFIKSFQEVYNNAHVFNDIVYHAISTSNYVRKFHLQHTKLHGVLLITSCVFLNVILTKIEQYTNLQM